MLKITLNTLAALTAVCAFSRPSWAVEDTLTLKMAVVHSLTDPDLQKFDREIQTPLFDLFQSESYIRLLAARQILDGLEHQGISENVSFDQFQSTHKKFLGATQFKEVLKSEGSIGVIRLAARDHWARIIAETDQKTLNQVMADIKPRLRQETQFAQQTISRQTLFSLVRGAFSNISGTGFGLDRWALTFDDGPHPRLTPLAINHLRRHGYQATFFVLAQNAKRYPTIINNLMSAGMEVANHSYDHKNLAQVGRAQLEKQILRSSDVIESITNRRLRYFRLPYGSGLNNSNVRRLISQRGLVHVAWNVDSLDWKGGSSTAIANRVAAQMRRLRGGVILFHDIHNRSILASEELMYQMNTGSIPGRFTTVSQAL